MLPLAVLVMNYSAVIQWAGKNASNHIFSLSSDASLSALSEVVAYTRYGWLVSM